MKKIILFFGLVISVSSISNAQTKTANKLGTSSKLSHADSVMCSKIWGVTSLEEQGTVTKPPADKNKNDLLAMKLDGKFNMIMSGAKKAGTWSRAGQNVYFADEASGQTLTGKVISVDPKIIKVEFRNTDGVAATFVMEPK